MGAGGLAPINAYGTPPQLADWWKDALVNRVLHQCRDTLHLNLRSVAARRYLRLRIVPLQPRQHLVQLRGQVAYGEFRLPFYVSAVVEMPGGNLLARESLQELLRLEAHMLARPEVQAWAYNTSAVVRSPGSAVNGTLALQNLTLETAPDPALQATLGALIEDPQAGGMFGASSQTDGCIPPARGRPASRRPAAAAPIAIQP